MVECANEPNRLKVMSKFQDLMAQEDLRPTFSGRGSLADLQPLEMVECTNEPNWLTVVSKFQDSLAQEDLRPTFLERGSLAAIGPSND